MYPIEAAPPPLQPRPASGLSLMKYRARELWSPDEPDVFKLLTHAVYGQTNLVNWNRTGGPEGGGGAKRLDPTKQEGGKHPKNGTMK